MKKERRPNSIAMVIADGEEKSSFSEDALSRRSLINGYKYVMVNVTAVTKKKKKKNLLYLLFLMDNFEWHLPYDPYGILSEYQM